MGSDKCIMTFGPIIIVSYRELSLPKKILSILPSPALPFPECQMVEIIQYGVFTDWLFSFFKYAFNAPLCLFMAWHLIYFQHWIIFHSLNVPQYLYPFTLWRSSSLHPSFGNYEKKSCYKHPCLGFYVDRNFNSA